MANAQGRVSMLKILGSARMMLAWSMGFASGLPLLLTLGTLQAWMKETGVDLTWIGIMSLVGLPYTLKFLWSPLFDRFQLPFLGRRRGWLLVIQICLIATTAFMGLTGPKEHPWLFAFAAFMVTFFSASQDILIDAFRRESLSNQELGLGSSLYVIGYRIGMYLGGAGALLLADHIPWPATYLCMAACMGVGIVTTLLAREPKVEVPPPKTFRESVIEPFSDYFSRTGAWWILSFILLYKVGESMASSMTTPFYLDLGFTKSEIAAVVKTLGLGATLAGGFIGGLCMLRLGIRRSLIGFGIFQSVCTLGFSYLAVLGHSVMGLSAIITVDNLATGMATSAYVAFMGTLTNKKFTATQYALLTSVMGIPRVLVAAPTGYMAKELGWVVFFVVCTLATIPGLWIIRYFKVIEESPVKTN
ncbi:MAG: AmpG family muropeptide MFS transporter [Bdellovibrionales bacterium]|nr:AmpG family muropeptide MFS transporter [Bdellovibrionales bacterium]